MATKSTLDPTELNLSKLLALINQSFNLEEIRILAFDLNIDFDSLSGKDKSTKARELITYFMRRGELGDLIALVSDARPMIDWDNALKIDDFRSKINSPTQHSQILRVESNAPSLLTAYEMTRVIVTIIGVINTLYSLIAVLTSKNKRTTEEFLRSIRKSPRGIGTELQLYLESANIEPLRVSKLNYGSPISLDLLGFGKVLEMVREIVTDLSGRGKIQKEALQLDNEKKRVEVSNSIISGEQAALEVAKKKLEIIESAMKLPLPEEEKRAILSALVTQFSSLSDVSSEMTTRLLSK